ncbi:MAG: acyl-CoA dehydrogenase family protein, partial [Limnospira maxima]
MEFSFSEDQLAVRDLARQIFSDRVTDDYHRQGAPAPDQSLWQTLAESGLLGLALPESCEGSGFGFLEVGLVLEEQGRVLAPVPLLQSLVMVAPALLGFGSVAQQQRWLPA